MKQLMLEKCIPETTADMWYLIVCSVDGKIADLREIRMMDLEKVFQLSMLQGFPALTYRALAAALPHEELCQPLFQRWRQAWSRVVKRRSAMDRERDQLLAFMEQKGIWYVPLKDVLATTYYMEIGSQYMVDHEILYDSRYRKPVYQWFLSRGYTAMESREGTTAVYRREPFYQFEMHHRIGVARNGQIPAYYQNIHLRLKKNQETECGYHLTDEDFYILFIDHAQDAYRKRELGFRVLVDCHMILKAIGENLCWGEIREGLRELGLTEFELQLRTLTVKAFGPHSSLNYAYFSQREINLIRALQQADITTLQAAAESRCEPSELTFRKW